MTPGIMLLLAVLTMGFAFILGVSARADTPYTGLPSIAALLILFFVFLGNFLLSK